MVQYIPLAITAMIAFPLLAFTIWLFVSKAKRQRQSEQMQRMFTEALDYGNALDGEKESKSAIQKMVDSYYNTLVGAGLINSRTPKNTVILRFVLIILAVFTVGFVVSGFQLFFAIIPTLLVVAGVYGYANHKIDNITHMMDEQIPSFLSTLKSNIQANQTPENALISAIDNTADPLYSELEIVKGLIESGTFETAMRTLRSKTKNDTLKFLCSCIELSSEVGANLEEQIGVIQEIIENRKVLERKLGSAVAENKPLLYVAMFSIPLLFVFMYFMNAQTRSFWFHGLISWVIFFFIVILCVFGYWMSNRLINGVRKM